MQRFAVHRPCQSSRAVGLTSAICVHTIIAVTNSFDPAKDAVNQAKHGVSLAIADRLEWDTAITWPDVRRDYGEPRMAGIGYIGQRLYCVAFVERDGGRRIISLRKANVREVRRYAET
jgi:uncharacterized DUF497 family protein